VTLTSDVPVIASLSHYNFTEQNADGSTGSTGSGSLTASSRGPVRPQQPNDTLGVLNAGSTAATVVFSFLFTNGSAYRTSLDVRPGRTASWTSTRWPTSARAGLRHLL